MVPVRIPGDVERTPEPLTLLSEGFPQMLFILRLLKAQRGDVTCLRSHSSPEAMEPGLEPSDLFPFVLQGLIMWTRHEGQRELGIGSEQVVIPINTAPSRPHAPKMSCLSGVWEELVTLGGHLHTHAVRKAKPELWGFPGRE